MKAKKIYLGILAVLVIAVGGIGFTYTSQRTPEYAIEQLGKGIATHDATAVKKYADVDQLIDTTYDEGTDLLANNIGDLQQKYPEDWFFRHDTAFMKDYIANRSSDDKMFIHRAIEFYLDPKIQPLSESDSQAKWIAGEMDKFEQNYSAKLVAMKKHGDKAEATVDIQGADTDYGKLVPELTLELELSQAADGHWKVTQVRNVKDAFYPVVDGIENYWTLQGWQ